MNVPPLAGTSKSPEQVVELVKSNDRHKTLAGKLSDEELTAIAGALPAGG